MLQGRSAIRNAHRLVHNTAIPGARVCVAHSAGSEKEDSQGTEMTENYHDRWEGMWGGPGSVQPGQVGCRLVLPDSWTPLCQQMQTVAPRLHDNCPEHPKLNRFIHFRACPPPHVDLPSPTP